VSRRPIPLVPVVLAALALPSSAAAATSGGAVPFGAPTVTAVSCARACPAVTRVTPGRSVVAITGTGLDRGGSVVFLGGKGAADDRRAPITASSPTSAEAVVPAGTHSGAVQVVAGDAIASTASKAKVTVGTGGDGTIDAVVTSKRVTAGGAQKAGVRWLTRDGSAVRVDLVKVPAGTVVRSWTPGAADAGTVRAVEWDGKVGGKLAAAGTYGFAVSVDAGDGARLTASSEAAPAPLSFAFVRDAFPILGAHTYNMSAGRFGAGRSGHTHQGQDVFAKCGTPLVAARSGVVQARTFQSLAGNYVVIDVDGSHQGDMYAHLRDPGSVKVGQKVAAGTPIGFVGDTGDAEGCHLHFEMWSAPGWYRGGSPFDPLASLKKWDRQ
jgi:murein DD-endopeptidase MepM/ murein hydrolase activator NlpD